MRRESIETRSRIEYQMRTVVRVWHDMHIHLRHDRDRKNAERGEDASNHDSRGRGFVSATTAGDAAP